MPEILVDPGEINEGLGGSDPGSGGTGLTQSQVDGRVRAGVEDWAEEGNTEAIPAGKLANAPSGGGLTESEVDARVTAGVEDWAENGNTEAIPAGKLTAAPGLSESEVDGRVRAGVEDWAEEGNTDAIPASKLANAPSGGGLTESEVDGRVRAGVEDWAEEGNTEAIPAGKLANAPSGGGLSESEVDGRVRAGVEDWAENGNTEAIPAGKLTAAPGLSEAEVDARIVDWAEEGNTDAIPASKLANAPSSGGGSALAPEILFDSTGTAGVTIDVEAGFGNTTANNGEFVFINDRVLVEADDSKLMLVWGTYTTGPSATRVTQTFSKVFSARQFRLLGAVAVGASNSANTVSHYVERFTSATFTSWGEGRLIFARGRDSGGGDVLRLAAAANSTSPSLGDVKVRVELIATAVDGDGETSWDGLTGKDAARPTHDEIVEHTSEEVHLWSPADVDNAINLHDYAQIGPYHYNINRDATDVDSQAAHFLGGIYKNISGRPFQIPEVFIPVTPDGSGAVEYNIYCWKVNKVSDASYTTSATEVTNYVTAKGGTNIGFDVTAGDLTELHGYLRTALIIHPDEYFAVGVDRIINGTNANTIVANGTTITQDYDGAIEYVSKASFAGTFAAAGGEELYHASTFAENMRLVFEYESPINASAYSLVQFWGPGQTEAMPPVAADRGSLIHGNNLRYQFDQEEPNEILVGYDPGIRALDADDAPNADTITAGSETLPDQAIIDFPAGYVYRVLLVGQHRASTDVHLSAWIYQVMTGEDDLIRQRGIGYTTAIDDPLGETENEERTTMTIRISEVLNFKEAGGQITFFAGSFNTGGSQEDGNWYLEIERLG